MKPFPLFLYLLIIGITSCTSPQKEPTEVTYHRHVGDIPFDPKLDDPSFTPCDEERAVQYYGFGEGIRYEGEKARIIRIYQEQYDKGSLAGEDGYIIIRFMVNCEGETGRFRMDEMDQGYEPKSFSPKISTQIFEIAKSLDGWKPGIYQENKYDYYQLLTFKILDSEISEIIP